MDDEKTTECWAIVKYESPYDRIDWTLDDLRFLYSIGVDFE